MRLTASLLLVGMCCLGAQASSITYITPAGSTVTAGPVDASATFTTGTGTIMVTLSNLQTNTHDVGQNLSDLFFTVGNGTVTGASEVGGSATAITIGAGGVITMTAPETTPGEVGWVLSTPTGTQIELNVLGGSGHAGPAHTIIGPPNASNVYSNANGSIAGNGPHNPFIEPTVTWVIDAPNVSSSTTITSATFSFGTTPGVTVVGAVIPEPSSMMLLGSGLLVLTQALRRKLS